MKVSEILSEIDAMKPADIARVLVASVAAAGRAGREVGVAAVRVVDVDIDYFDEGAGIVAGIIAGEYSEPEDYSE